MLALVALVALKCAVSTWALRTGFTHVSDDDYARVTIAQAFAHAPALDPSGTSWLPFPFWLNGVAMMIGGRSLAVARGVAGLSSTVGLLFVHRNLLRTGVRPWAAFAGVALTTCAPWSVWLGVATVPEALTAALVVGAALTLAPGAGGRLAGAAALLAACLSRYEAWPVAAVFAVASLRHGTTPGVPPRARRRAFVAAALALAGPAAWLLWNAHAHGDPLHFLVRVARFRQLTRGGAPEPWTAALALYPAAFVRAAPWSVGLACAGSVGLLVDRSLLRRWTWPFVAMAAMVAFLIEGDLRDGAPTHHPERALVAIAWVATTFGVDGLRSLAVRFVWRRAGREAWLVAGVAAVGVAWAAGWPASIAAAPGTSLAEDRAAQVEKGAELREARVMAITVTPCAYEHFALIASYGAPERVTVAPPRPSTGGPCPAVAYPGATMTP